MVTGRDVGRNIDRQKQEISPRRRALECSLNISFMDSPKQNDIICLLHSLHEP